jgi:DNA-binding HxlR family transcriptional regulator
MLGRLYEGQWCSAARALEIVGERWSLLILRDAFFAGYTRFSDFQRSLGIAPNILARRLQSFVEEGLMQMRPSDANAEYSEYVLTPKGMDFKPAIVALTEWGERWSSEPGPVLFTHEGCQGHVHQELLCAECGKALKVTDVVARPKEVATNRKRRTRAGRRARNRKN